MKEMLDLVGNIVSICLSINGDIYITTDQSDQIGIMIYCDESTAKDEQD